MHRTIERHTLCLANMSTAEMRYRNALIQGRVERLAQDSKVRLHRQKSTADCSVWAPKMPFNVALVNVWNGWNTDSLTDAIHARFAR